MVVFQQKHVGVGLRDNHFSYIEQYQPDIPWFEVLTDNYLNLSERSLFQLEKICSHYPVAFHGVGMSLGSTDPLNIPYLKKLKTLIKLFNPILISDHLCWTSFSGRYFHELLPLPYTQEAVFHLANRIRQVQDFLEHPIIIENVSHYLSYTHSDMKEWEFLQAVANTADCSILLDINNIYVSAYNNKFVADDYINHLSAQRIAQFHLAGFSKHENYLLDHHGAAVQDPVWDLYKKALQKFGKIPTIIEWDNNIPDFYQLQNEADYAQKLMNEHTITV